MHFVLIRSLSSLYFQLRVPMTNLISKRVVFNVADVVQGKTYSPLTYDCYFRVEDEVVGAHRELLSTLSTEFSERFNCEWSIPDEIFLPDITYDAFTAFMEYFYWGSVDIEANSAEQMLELAHTFKVHALIPHCIKAITNMLSIETIIETLAFATRLGSIELKHICTDLISKFTEEILQYEVNRLCDLKTMQTILEAAERRSCSERAVLHFCLKWSASMCRLKKIDDNCGWNLRNELDVCYELIRFKELKGREFWSLYSGSLGEFFSKQEADQLLKHFMRDD